MMQVLVDGVVVGSTEVRSTEPADYRFDVPALVAGSKVDVVFTNDAAIGGVNRDLFVSYLIAGATYALPSMPGVVYDIGQGSAAFDGLSVISAVAGEEAGTRALAMVL